MTTRRPWTGCGTALVTPFTRSGGIDDVAIRRLVRRQIDSGIHFLVPCGTTGENPTLSLAERRRVVETVVDEARGRVPVLAGAGGYHTEEVASLAEQMARSGAAGVLSVTPYYNRPTPEGLYRHFSTIADRAGVPVVLYNVPSRTGCHIDISTLRRLQTIPGVAGIKEASGNIAHIVDVCALAPPGFVVLAGDDAVTLPVMALGGHGVISVVSNETPREMTALVEAIELEDYGQARALQARLLPLMQVNFVESNPIPVKAALAAMGLIEEVYRLPLVSPQETSRQRILDVLAGLGLVDRADLAREHAA
jgi:4-hydroxy-tetrahydrodipicolinate synthase